VGANSLELEEDNMIAAGSSLSKNFVVQFIGGASQVLRKRSFGEPDMSITSNGTTGRDGIS